MKTSVIASAANEIRGCNSGGSVQMRTQTGTLFP
jgi:hypothetical protein